MSEYKLSENNWTRVAVFAGGDRGHYRTDFDCFVGVYPVKKLVSQRKKQNPILKKAIL